MGDRRDMQPTVRAPVPSATRCECLFIFHMPPTEFSHVRPRETWLLNSAVGSNWLPILNMGLKLGVVLVSSRLDEFCAQLSLLATQIIWTEARAIEHMAVRKSAKLEVGVIFCLRAGELLVATSCWVASGDGPGI